MTRHVDRGQQTSSRIVLTMDDELTGMRLTAPGLLLCLEHRTYPFTFQHTAQRMIAAASRGRLFTVSCTSPYSPIAVIFYSVSRGPAYNWLLRSSLIVVFASFRRVNIAMLAFGLRKYVGFKRLLSLPPSLSSFSIELEMLVLTQEETSLARTSFWISIGAALFIRL